MLIHSIEVILLTQRIVVRIKLDNACKEHSAGREDVLEEVRAGLCTVSNWSFA